MRRFRNIAVGAALLALAGCAKHKVAAPAVPPVPTAVPRQPPKPRVAAPAPVVPAPSTTVQTPPLARPPLTLESRTDPAIERSAVEARIKTVQGLLAQLNSSALRDTAKEDRTRVASMLVSAQQSLASGDLRQANDLSLRAETLARTLLNAR